MDIALKRIKAALGIGAIWGATFSMVGAALGGVLPTTSFLSTAVGLGMVAGVGGFVLGAGFAGLLSAMEVRRTVAELSTRRAALWGFLSGSSLALAGSVVIGSLLGVVGAAEAVLGLSIPLPLQVAALVTGAVSYGAVAAGLASATLAIAKRAPSVLPSERGRPNDIPGTDGSEASQRLTPGTTT